MPYSAVPQLIQSARYVCVAVAFVVSIVMNALAGAGIFGKGIGEISDENPTFVTPDGITFAVWGLIYTLLTICVSAQLCPSDNANQLLDQKMMNLDVRQRLTIAFLLNAVWLPFYVKEYFWVALAIIVFYFVALASVYTNINTKQTMSFCEWLAYAAPVATNASWVAVASVANLFTCLRVAGWKDEYGVGGSAPAAILVSVLVTGVASLLVFANRSVMWSSVAAWALLGIYRMQTVPDAERFPVDALNSTIASAAMWGVGLVGAASVVGLILALIGWCSYPRAAPYGPMGIVE